MLPVQLFVYFARVKFCTFCLLLGVRGCLRLMIVALPGPINFFTGGKI